MSKIEKKKNDKMEKKHLIFLKKKIIEGIAFEICNWWISNIDLTKEAENIKDEYIEELLEESILKRDLQCFEIDDVEKWEKEVNKMEKKICNFLKKKFLK